MFGGGRPRATRYLNSKYVCNATQKERGTRVGVKRGGSSVNTITRHTLFALGILMWKIRALLWMECPVGGNVDARMPKLCPI